MKDRRIRLAGAALAAGLAILASQSTAQNHHYRWTDEQGETVYSDRPPPAGVDYEIVSSTSSFSQAVKSRQDALATEPDAGVEDAGAGGAPADQQAQAKATAEFCAKARANLETLNGSARIVIRTDEGETRALSEEEIEEQKRTTQSQITTYCE